MVKHYGWKPMAYFHYLLSVGFTRHNAKVTVLVTYSRDPVVLRERLERLFKRRY